MFTASNLENPAELAVRLWVDDVTWGVTLTLGVVDPYSSLTLTTSNLIRVNSSSIMMLYRYFPCISDAE